MEYMSAKDLAAEIRKELKEAFPRCKFAVSKHSYAGGRSINVYLMEAPNPISPEYMDEFIRRGHNASVNSYSIARGEQGRGYPLNQEGHKLWEKALRIINKRNWDNSDTMTDYYDVNFATHLGIGQWGKPFKETK